MSALPQTPEAFADAFAAAWMARDAEALGALFAEDADFVNVVGIWWRDRAGIVQGHGRALKGFFADTRLTPGRLGVRGLGEDHVVLHCRWRLSGQRAPDGASAAPRQTMMMAVLERGADGWRAVAAQNTEIVPGAETVVASVRYGEV